MISIHSLIKYSAISIVLVCILKIFNRFFNKKIMDSANCSFEIHKQSTYQVMAYILGWFFRSRLVILVTTYYYHALKTGRKPFLIHAFKDIWYRWDSPHYISIAENWYLTTGDERFFIVFYPLYPILIKLVHILIQDYFLSGIFVSNLFLILGAYYLFRLLEMEYKNISLARRAVKYLFIFPFSFFFSIAYTESLFLALSIMCFYYARKRLFLISCIFGMLAALTRNQGLLLVLPIIMEMLEQENFFRAWKGGKFNLRYKEIIKSALYISLVPFGFFIYLAINKYVTGEWFKFLEYQKEHWHQSFGFFGNNLDNHFINISKMEWRLAVGIWIPQIILFFLAFILLIYNINKMKLSYIIYSFTYIIISYSPTWLLSGPRYLAGLFTLYVMFANFEYRFKYINIFVNLIFLILLCFYSIQFYLWNVY
jgi:Gpi18-like mannosyltransferase